MVECTVAANCQAVASAKLELSSCFRLHNELISRARFQAPHARYQFLLALSLETLPDPNLDRRDTDLSVSVIRDSIIINLNSYYKFIDNGNETSNRTTRNPISNQNKRYNRVDWNLTSN